MKTLTFRLGGKIARALNAEAERTGLTKSEIARQALETRLQPNSKLLVMSNYFGMISGPSDLSTNKKYYRIKV